MYVLSIYTTSYYQNRYISALKEKNHQYFTESLILYKKV